MLSIILTLAIFIVLTLLPATNCLADNPEKNYSNKYVKVQYAGNIGLISVGIGDKFFSNKMSLDFNYGLTPENINGAQVHTYALKTAFHFKEHAISGIVTNCYLGTVFNYNVTSNTYVKFPGYYPEGYYVPNAFHSNPFVGTRIRVPGKIGVLDKLSLYAELGSVDYKILYYFKNKKIKLNEILNLCFGLEINKIFTAK